MVCPGKRLFPAREELGDGLHTDYVEVPVKGGRVASASKSRCGH